MTWWGDQESRLLGFTIAAAEWGSAFGVAHLAWALLRRDVDPGVVAGLCALSVFAWAMIGGAAFHWGVKGR